MYSQTTRAITVAVLPIYLEDQSEPDDGHFVWAYQVTIDNGGAESVQLLRRHWIITDGLGHVQEVEGPGVVGEQPVLKPGERFVYTSGTPLPTPSGFMRGTYGMRMVSSGETFDVVVPAFSLDSPHGAHSIH
ncbi:Co2+/Mg2+ efflux protein ApaG [Roseospira visakhapatnamensis]|uniref:Protein ApaG n=1 Tax=Roseospira visakhapatnamensis TaxID=390880 RepID=A0A7W6RBZ3_9PROT|nr:Co2+/Mg2+ efflux protein ApaG [Roseospira visakhapatnamensis]MBB4265572.1 ApaG protein [Roseospira visakhapatnamensis]